MNTWNQRLVSAMTLRGISNADLAKRAGVSAPTVTDWTSGEIKKISAENAIKIAYGLNISILWLITGKGPMGGDDPQSAPDIFPREPSEDDFALIPQYTARGGFLCAPKFRLD